MQVEIWSTPACVESVELTWLKDPLKLTYLFKIWLFKRQPAHTTPLRRGGGVDDINDEGDVEVRAATAGAAACADFSAVGAPRSGGALPTSR